jgi:hypothetical protein
MTLRPTLVYCKTGRNIVMMTILLFGEFHPLVLMPLFPLM